MSTTNRLFCPNFWRANTRNLALLGGLHNSQRVMLALTQAGISREDSDAFALADSTRLDTLPGTRFVYSDLGAILLTQIVERSFGERLDSLLQRRLFTPLRMTDTRYLPPAEWLPRIAPTSTCTCRSPMREKLIGNSTRRVPPCTSTSR